MFFIYRWAADPRRPGATSPYGWYVIPDQSYYLREAHFLGHLQAIPAEQFNYGPGYPLLAAPFARSSDIGWPFHDPFFLPNLAIWLLTVATTFLIGRRLYGQVVAGAVAVALMLATPLISFVVIPWNSSAVLAALMLTLLVALPRQIRAWHACVLGFAVSLSYSSRYVDALWIAGVALTVVAVRSASVARAASILGVCTAAAIITALPTFYLQWKAFGNPFSTPYGKFGLEEFRASNVLPHGVQEFVAPFLLTKDRIQFTSMDAQPLLASMFLLVFVPVGLIQTIRSSNRPRRRLIYGTAASCLLATVFYLSYFFTGVTGIQDGSTHFLKMWFPLWTLAGICGIVTTFRFVIRSEWRPLLGRRISRRTFRWSTVVLIILAVVGTYILSSGRLTPTGRTLPGRYEGNVIHAFGVITSYCTEPSPSALPTTNAEISALIRLYRSNSTAILGPGVFAGGTLRDFLRDVAATLECAPGEQARLLKAAKFEPLLNSPGAQVAYGAGWQPEERDTKGHAFRWMDKAEATLTISRAAGSVQAPRLHAFVGSLAIKRRLTVSLGSNVLGTFSVPANRSRPISVAIPLGKGTRALTLKVAPGPQSATVVNPDDHRLLAINVSRVRLSSSRVAPAPEQKLAFGRGWSVEEHNAEGQAFHWMDKAVSTLRLPRGAAQERPLELTAFAGSLAVPRRLTVRLGATLLGTFSVPANESRRISVLIPPGHASRTLTLTVTPGPQSATVANPRDHRLLAVNVSRVRLNLPRDEASKDIVPRPLR